MQPLIMTNNSSNKMIKYLPNSLTITRMLIIPTIVITFYFDDKAFAHRLAAALFIIASITDFFDGYIARAFNAHSNFGKMFDPIADKLLVGSILIMLVKFNKAQEIPCLLIMAREFVIAGLREFLASVRVSVPVTQLAKIKTGVQMVAITILLLGSTGSGWKYMDHLGQIALWCAAILTIVTGYSYLKASSKFFS